MLCTRQPLLQNHSPRPTVDHTPWWSGFITRPQPSQHGHARGSSWPIMEMVCTSGMLAVVVRVTPGGDNRGLLARIRAARFFCAHLGAMQAQHMQNNKLPLVQERPDIPIDPRVGAEAGGGVAAGVPGEGLDPMQAQQQAQLTLYRQQEEARRNRLHLQQVVTDMMWHSVKRYAKYGLAAAAVLLLVYLWARRPQLPRVPPAA